MPNHNQSVIIIGAGIAGIAAANRLAAHGIHAIILEARDRIGGRIWTDYSLDVPISLGAQWMHGTIGNPLTDLAAQLALHFVDTEFRYSLFYDRHGQLIPTEISALFFEEFEEILANAKNYALNNKQDISLLTALNAVCDPKLHSSTWQDLYARAISFLALYSGADAKYLSARYWDQEEILPGGNPFLIEGYTPIIYELARNCDIRLETIVSEIIYDDKNIRVITNHEEIMSDKVIVTIPLGALKKDIIKFTPKLSQAKIDAINKLDMGILDSLVLKFSNVFWPTARFGMNFCENRFDFKFISNLYSFYQEPILNLRVAGDQAKELEQLSDADWLDKAMHDLQHYFGNAVLNPQQYIIARWGNEPFTYGSYSYIPLGATGEEHDVLAESIENKLFFAGEATHRTFPATVHGAYLSGIREADKILNT